MSPAVRAPSPPARPAPRPSGDATRAEPGPAAPAVAARPWRAVLTVAWLAVLLGFVIEGLLLGVAAATGAAAQPRSFLGDLAGKVSWSVIVCGGVGIGTAAAKARPAVMGALGLVAAPASFTVAKTVQKAIGAALGLAGVAGGPSPWLIAALKAAEYGVYGALLGKLSARHARLGAYAATGAAIGVGFGGVLVAVLSHGVDSGAAAIASRAINEVVFPLGCGLVLYAAENLAPAH